MTGMFTKVGTSDMAYSQNTLAFDFEWEKTYEKKSDYLKQFDTTEYDAMVETLLEKYHGKYVSVLGDSISTFDGISNNKSYNETIGNNAVYNFRGTEAALNNNGLYDQKDAYWHRLLTDLCMELCVNNSWSGSTVIDSAPNRALQLHNTKSEEPDVILFYMGINDLHNKKPMGDLYALLESKTDTRSDSEKIKEWLKSSSFTGSASFEQAYAKALMNMTEKYENAEVWCMSLLVNADSRFTTTAMNQYNRCIEALAEYFGCNYIDQNEGYITRGTCIAYSCDGKGLHPNPTGHALMEKHIVESFYEKMINE